MNDQEEKFMKWRIYSLENSRHEITFGCDNCEIIDGKILRLFNNAHHGHYTITIAYIPLHKYITERIK